MLEPELLTATDKHTPLLHVRTRTTDCICRTHYPMSELKLLVASNKRIPLLKVRTRHSDCIWQAYYCTSELKKCWLRLTNEPLYCMWKPDLTTASDKCTKNCNCRQSYQLFSRNKSPAEIWVLELLTIKQNINHKLIKITPNFSKAYSALHFISPR